MQRGDDLLIISAKIAHRSNGLCDNHGLMPISYAVRQEDNQHALCGSDFTSAIRALVLGLVFYTIRALRT
ncbi:MAG: hypothetical protein WCF29_25455 [Pseudolabrys sp.]